MQPWRVHLFFVHAADFESADIFLNLPDVCLPVIRLVLLLSPAITSSVTLHPAVGAESIPLSFAFLLVAGALASCLSSLSPSFPFPPWLGAGCSALCCNVGLVRRTCNRINRFCCSPRRHRKPRCCLPKFPRGQLTGLDRIALHGIRILECELSLDDGRDSVSGALVIFDLVGLLEVWGQHGRSIWLPSSSH